MSTDLLCSALIHLLLGFTNSFYAFVLLWGLNGWFQSMRAASGVVSLSRWYNSKECGTYYSFWSASHNIGEAFTFMTIALIVGWMGWRYGMIGAGGIGLLGFLMMITFMRVLKARGSCWATRHPLPMVMPRNSRKNLVVPRKRYFVILPFGY